MNNFRQIGCLPKHITILLFFKGIWKIVNRILQKSERGRRVAADMARQALGEWALMRALAWSERMIIVVASLLFLINEDREFWTLSGFGFIVTSLVLLGPVYGIFMFMSLQYIYKAMGKGKNPPADMAPYIKAGYPVFAIWAPIMFILSYHAMNFYYELLVVMAPRL